MKIARSALLLLMLIGSSSWAQQWSLSLAGPSNDLIAVKLRPSSAAGEQSGQIIHNIRFIVTYFDSSGQTIATQSYLYLDSQLRTVVPGLIYERSFVHGLRGVDRAEGTDMTYTGFAGGGEALSSRRPATSQDLGVSNRAIAAPAQREVTKTDVCQDYAHTAIAQNKQNETDRCNYSGSRWSSEFGHHFNWCVTAKNAEIVAERRTRDSMLGRCRR